MASVCFVAFSFFVAPSGACAQDTDEGAVVGEEIDLLAIEEEDGPASVVLPRPEEAVQPSLYWNPRWGRAGFPNFAMLGASGLLILGNLILGSDEERPTRGGWLFDEEARDALRLPVEQQRLIARDFSDGFLTALTSFPVLIDALVLTAWQHHAPEIAVEMMFIHAEVIIVTLTLQTLANVIVSRERPYGRTCGGGGPDDLPGDSFFCDSPDRYYSFFSGHTSQSFASAAVLCTFHMNFPLLGGGPTEAVPCATAFVAAGVTGMLRMLGDMHYATDVITGAVVGTLSGFLVPWLLHFRERDPSSDSDGGGGLNIAIIPTPTGASMAGIF